MVTKYCPDCNYLGMYHKSSMVCSRCDSALVELTDMPKIEREGVTFEISPTLGIATVCIIGHVSCFQMQGNTVNVYGIRVDIITNLEHALKVMKLASQICMRAPASYGGFNGRTVFIDSAYVKEQLLLELEKTS